MLAQPRPEIHFESGLHPGDDFTDPLLRLPSTPEVHDRFRSGDADAHVWNKAVARRIRTYEPDLLGLDSAWAPVGFRRQYNRIVDVDHLSKTALWLLLPGTPTAMNGRDQIRVIAGDNALGAATNSPLDSFLSGGLGRWIAAGAAVPAAAAIRELFRSFKLIPQLRTLDEETIPAFKRMHRRHLFRGLGSGLLATGLMTTGAAPSITGGLASLASSENMADHLENLSDQTQSIGAHDVYVDGRTALVITKTRSTLERYAADGYQVGSVVMGTAHTAQSAQFLDDPSSADPFIAAHTKELFELAAKKNLQAYGRPIPREAQTERIRRLQSRVVVFDVRQPDLNRFKDNPTREIDKCIQLVEVYQDPQVRQVVDRVEPYAAA